MSYLNPNYLAEIQDVINSDIRASAVNNNYNIDRRTLQDVCLT